MSDSICYFAYGSNLLFARLHARCPSIVNLGVARLDQHRLSFTKPGGDASGKCGIAETTNGDFVLGVLYGMSPEDKVVLDVIEGVGHGYEARPIRVSPQPSAEQCAHVECFTYYPTLEDHDLLPFDWYKQFVLQGARENSFPEEYLASILAVAEVMDHDDDRRRQNMAILGNL